MVHNGVRVSKKKTHTKRRTASPIFNESFIFDIPYSGAAPAGPGPGQMGSNSSLNACPLDDIQLELRVYHHDRMTRHELIGRLTLGRGSGELSAARHWSEVGAAPRRQLAEWHKLS